jgi:PKD domain
MRHSLIAIALFAVISCGGSGGSSTPTTPTTPTPPPQQNRNPVITSTTVSPTFGIAELQSFSFTAIASDPDGDVVSYSWNAAGNPMNGANPPPMIFASPGGNGQAELTVSDGKGGSASSSVNFTVGSMSGFWQVDTGMLRGSTFQLTQSGAIVTGSFSLPGIGNGNTDPAQPGQINPAGALSMRVKIGAFADFNMNGTMDTSGRRVAGTLQGSGFTGQPFAMQKQ